MHNVCSECRRKFNPDLRYCPYCGGEAKVPVTKGWNYGEGELIRSSDPVKDEHQKVYKQNGFMLLVAIILLVPAFVILLEELLDLLSEAIDLVIIAIIVYGISVFLVVVYGTICAFYARRPGAQILAAFLLWANITWIYPIVFLIVGVVFFIIWGMGASRSGSFMKPDPTYLVIMTCISLMCIVGGYVWLLSAPMTIDL